MSDILDSLLDEINGYDTPYGNAIMRESPSLTDQAVATWNDTWMRHSPTVHLYNAAVSRFQLSKGNQLTEDEFNVKYPKQVYGISYRKGMTDLQAESLVQRKIQWASNYSIIEEASRYPSALSSTTNFLVGLFASVLDPVNLAVSKGIAGATAKFVGRPLASTDRFVKYKRLKAKQAHYSKYKGSPIYDRYSRILKNRRRALWLPDMEQAKNWKPNLISNFAASMAIEPFLIVGNLQSGLPYSFEESAANVAFSSAFGTLFPMLPPALQQMVFVGGAVGTAATVLPAATIGAAGIALAGSAPIGMAKGKHPSYFFGGALYEKGKRQLNRLVNSDPELMEESLREEIMYKMLGHSVEDPSGLEKVFKNPRNLEDLAKYFGDSFDLAAKYMMDVGEDMGFENGRQVRDWIMDNHSQLTRAMKRMGREIVKERGSIQPYYNPEAKKWEVSGKGKYLDFGEDPKKRAENRAKNRRDIENLEAKLEEQDNYLLQNQELINQIKAGAITDAREISKAQSAKKRIEKNIRELHNKIDEITGFIESDRDQIELLAQFLIKLRAEMGLTVKLKDGAERVSMLNEDEFIFTHSNQYKNRVGDWEQGDISPLLLEDGEPAPFFIVDEAEGKMLIVKDPSMLDRSLRTGERVFPQLRSDEIFEIDLNKNKQFSRALKEGEFTKAQILKLLTDPDWTLNLTKSAREKLLELLEGARYLKGLNMNDLGDDFFSGKHAPKINAINIVSSDPSAGQPKVLSVELENYYKGLIKTMQDLMEEAIAERPEDTESIKVGYNKVITKLENAIESGERIFGDQLVNLYNPKNVSEKEVAEMLKTSQGLFNVVDGSKQILKRRRDKELGGKSQYEMLRDKEATSIHISNGKRIPVNTEYKRQKLSSYISKDNHALTGALRALVGDFSNKSLSQLKHSVRGFEGFMDLLLSWYNKSDLTQRAKDFLEARKADIEDELRRTNLPETKITRGEGQSLFSSSAKDIETSQRRIPVEGEIKDPKTLARIERLNSWIETINLFASERLDWDQKDIALADANTAHNVKATIKHLGSVPVDTVTRTHISNIAEDLEPLFNVDSNIARGNTYQSISSILGLDPNAVVEYLSSIPEGKYSAKEFADPNSGYMQWLNQAEQNLRSPRKWLPKRTQKTIRAWLARSKDIAEAFGKTDGQVIFHSDSDFNAIVKSRGTFTFAPDGFTDGNTIHIKKSSGADPYVLMHEMEHGVLGTYLDNADGGALRQVRQHAHAQWRTQQLAPELGNQESIRALYVENLKDALAKDKIKDQNIKDLATAYLAVNEYYVKNGIDSDVGGLRDPLRGSPIPDLEPYFLTDLDEFIAEYRSDEATRRILSQIKAPKEGFASVFDWINHIVGKIRNAALSLTLGKKSNHDASLLDVMDEVYANLRNNSTNWNQHAGPSPNSALDGLKGLGDEGIDQLLLEIFRKPTTKGQERRAINDLYKLLVGYSEEQKDLRNPSYITPTRGEIITVDQGDGNSLLAEVEGVNRLHGSDTWKELPLPAAVQDGDGWKELKSITKFSQNIINQDESPANWLQFKTKYPDAFGSAMGASKMAFPISRIADGSISAYGGIYRRGEPRLIMLAGGEQRNAYEYWNEFLTSFEDTGAAWKWIDVSYSVLDKTQQLVFSQQTEGSVINAFNEAVKTKEGILLARAISIYEKANREKINDVGDVSQMLEDNTIDENRGAERYIPPIETRSGKTMEEAINEAANQLQGDGSQQDIVSYTTPEGLIDAQQTGKVPEVTERDPESQNEQAIDPKFLTPEDDGSVVYTSESVSVDMDAFKGAGFKPIESVAPEDDLYSRFMNPVDFMHLFQQYYVNLNPDSNLDVTSLLEWERVEKDLPSTPKTKVTRKVLVKNEEFLREFSQRMGITDESGFSNYGNGYELNLKVLGKKAVEGHRHPDIKRLNELLKKEGTNKTKAAVIKSVSDSDAVVIIAPVSGEIYKRSKKKRTKGQKREKIKVKIGGGKSGTNNKIYMPGELTYSAENIVNQIKDAKLAQTVAKIQDKPVYVIAGQWNHLSNTSELDTILGAAGVRNVHLVGDLKKFNMPDHNAKFDDVPYVIQSLEELKQGNIDRLNEIKERLQQIKDEQPLDDQSEMASIGSFEFPATQESISLANQALRIEAAIDRQEHEHLFKRQRRMAKVAAPVRKLSNNAFVSRGSPASKVDGVMEYTNSGKKVDANPENVIRYVRVGNGDIKILHLKFEKTKLTKSRKIPAKLGHSARLESVNLYDFGEYIKQRNAGIVKPRDFSKLQVVNDLPEAQALISEIKKNNRTAKLLRHNPQSRDAEFSRIFNTLGVESLDVETASQDANIKNMRRMIEAQAGRGKKAIAYKLGDSVSMLMLNPEQDLQAFQDPITASENIDRQELNKARASTLNDLLTEHINRTKVESLDNEDPDTPLSSQDYSSSIDSSAGGKPLGFDSTIARTFQDELPDINDQSNLIKNNVITSENEYGAHRERIITGRLKGNLELLSQKYNLEFQQSEEGKLRLIKADYFNSTDRGIHSDAFLHIKKLIQDDLAIMSEYEALEGPTTQKLMKEKFDKLKKRQEIHEEIKSLTLLIDAHNLNPNQNFADFLISYINGGQEGLAGEASSIARAAKVQGHNFMGMLTQSLDEANLLDDFNKEVYAREVDEAMHRMALKQDVSHIQPRAVKMANIIHNVSLIKLSRQNQQGFEVVYKKGRVSSRSHSPERMRSPGVTIKDRLMFKRMPSYEQAKTTWADFLLGLNLDLNVMFGVNSMTQDGRWLVDTNSSFGKFYQGELTKRYGKKAKGLVDNVEYDPMSQDFHKLYLGKMFDNIINSSGNNDSPFSRLKQLDLPTVIHFTDWESESAYRDEYGSRSWSQNILHDLQMSGEAVGIASHLGVNAERNFKNIMNLYRIPIQEGMKVQNVLSDTAKRGLPMLGPQEYFDNVMGYHNIPEAGFPATLAKIGAYLRGSFITSFLGKAAISSLPDIAAGDFIARSNGIKKLTSLRTKLMGMNKTPEGRRSLQLMGVGAETWINSAALKFGYNEHVPGLFGNIIRKFFKVSQIDSMLRFNQERAASILGANMGMNADKNWGDLDPALQQQLKRYSIFEKEWNVIRQGVVEVDSATVGKIPMIMSDSVRNLSNSSLAEYAGSNDREGLLKAKKYITDLLNSYFIGEIDASTVMPGSWEMTNAYFGTRSGSAAGEAARFGMQFKTYPLAVQRQLWSRGMMKNQDSNNYMPMVGWAAQCIVWGVIASMIKEALQFEYDENESEEDAISKVSEAIRSSGAGGLVGEVILSGRHESRGGMADKILDFAGGPLYDRASAIMQGNLHSEGGRKKLFHEAVKTIPGSNLPLIDVAIETMIWDGVSGTVDQLE